MRALKIRLSLFLGLMLVSSLVAVFSESPYGDIAFFKTLVPGAQAVTYNTTYHTVTLTYNFNNNSAMGWSRELSGSPLLLVSWPNYPSGSGYSIWQGYGDYFDSSTSNATIAWASWNDSVTHKMPQTMGHKTLTFPNHVVSCNLSFWHYLTNTWGTSEVYQGYKIYDYGTNTLVANYREAGSITILTWIQSSTYDITSYVSNKTVGIRPGMMYKYSAQWRSFDLYIDQIVITYRYFTQDLVPSTYRGPTQMIGDTVPILLVLGLVGGAIIIIKRRRD